MNVLTELNCRLSDRPVHVQVRRAKRRGLLPPVGYAVRQIPPLSSGRIR